MYNKEPRQCCSYSIPKQRRVHHAGVEHPQLPYQNIELRPTFNSLPTPSSSNKAWLTILTTAVPWGTGEASIHGAREMLCSEGANSKKHRCGDHGTVVWNVSQEVEGVKVTMEEDCPLCVVLEDWMSKVLVSLERIRKIQR